MQYNDKWKYYSGFATTGIKHYYGLTLFHSSNGNFYLYNGHGDVVQLIDQNRNILHFYEYDAFGNEKNPNVTDTNYFRYTGQYFDIESGTYYLKARYYNPANGRFTQQDAWGYENFNDPLSLNLYSYCGSNPVMYIDPSGHIIELSANTKDEQRLQYEIALAYLKQSPTAKALIERLEASDEIIIIVLNNYSHDEYVANTRTIYWDTTAAAVLVDNSVQSPALALAHEMGHAAQHLDGTIESNVLYADTGVAKIEKNNLSTYETPIAKELGEFTREKYSDGIKYQRVSGSTDWGIIKHTGWNLFNMREYFISYSNPLKGSVPYGGKVVAECY